MSLLLLSQFQTFDDTATAGASAGATFSAVATSYGVMAAAGIQVSEVWQGLAGGNLADMTAAASAAAILECQANAIGTISGGASAAATFDGTVVPAEGSLEGTVAATASASAVFLSEATALATVVSTAQASATFSATIGAIITGYLELYEVGALSRNFTVGPSSRSYWIRLERTK